jgi:hypothetical protein
MLLSLTVTLSVAIQRINIKFEDLVRLRSEVVAEVVEALGIDNPAQLNPNILNPDYQTPKIKPKEPPVVHAPDRAIPNKPAQTGPRPSKRRKHGARRHKRPNAPPSVRWLKPTTRRKGPSATSSTRSATSAYLCGPCKELRARPSTGCSPMSLPIGGICSMRSSATIGNRNPTG